MQRCTETQHLFYACIYPKFISLKYVASKHSYIIIFSCSHYPILSYIRVQRTILRERPRRNFRVKELHFDIFILFFLDLIFLNPFLHFYRLFHHLIHQNPSTTITASHFSQALRQSLNIYPAAQLRFALI